MTSRNPDPRWLTNHEEMMFWVTFADIHDTFHDTAVIKCYTCMDDGIIITDFALGIGIAGEQNCPDCGDGERIEHG